MDANSNFPFAVDFPIPPLGNADRVLVILHAAAGCKGGAEVTTYSEPDTGEIRQWFNRVSTRSETEADRLARTFRNIGARRVG